MTSDVQMVVVDTSVVSILFNNRDKSDAYGEVLDGRRAFISFQTLEEKMYGAYLAGWGAPRIGELNRHILHYTVIWPNQELVEISARIRSQGEKQGRRLHVADSWIATTAILLGCPLVADDGDFEGVQGLELIRF